MRSISAELQHLTFVGCKAPKKLFYSCEATAVQKTETFSVAAVMWGQKLEIHPIRAYKKSLKPGHFMDEAGIFTSSCGFLGASPDGMVRGGEKIVELVEVKCPHRAHHGAVPEMCIVHLTAVCNQG